MGHRILIIDDSLIVRKVLIKTLGMTRLNIEEILQAENGAVALSLLQETKVDLVFLDINMPVMNGMEFMQHLRRDAKLCRLPVVVISTEGSTDRRQTLFEKEIKAYLRKPVTPEQLTETVCSILGGTGQ